LSDTPTSGQVLGVEQIGLIDHRATSVSSDRVVRRTNHRAVTPRLSPLTRDVPGAEPVAARLQVPVVVLNPAKAAALAEATARTSCPEMARQVVI
jgi:predicted NBD/HSP70 family sugar kinase